MLMYDAPLRQMEFLADKVFKVGQMAADMPFYGFWGNGQDFLGQVEADAKRILLPLMMSGDREGCTLHDRKVTTPAGFKEAHLALAAAGYTSMEGDPEYGSPFDPRLPKFLTTMAKEIMIACNPGFSPAFGLTMGAYDAIKEFGSERQKSYYLPRFLSGEWSGAMCLTEPHAGTDVGEIKARADRDNRITGNKIFISAGEQDMNENIVQLVLARTPGSPEGTKGISLFIVPKFLPDGSRNDYHCDGIEHKEGLHGSPTCSLQFEGAQGELLGKEREGMKAMFVMMNNARLAVALQGQAVAEIGFQNALAYATTRPQGKFMLDAQDPNAKPVPIINHANIQNDLLRIEVELIALRALAFETAINMDRMKHLHVTDTSKRRDEIILATAFVDLMTPILKASMTELGVRSADTAMKIHGGAGYIRDTGIEQLCRDAPIFRIYEGTNFIQALDLVGRKMLAMNNHGLNYSQTLRPLREEWELAARSGGVAAPYAQTLRDTWETVTATVSRLENYGMSGNMLAIQASAESMLRMMSLTMQGLAWIKMMKAAEGERGEFHERQIALGRYFFENVLDEEMPLLVHRVKMAENAGYHEKRPGFPGVKLMGSLPPSPFAQVA